MSQDYLTNEDAEQIRPILEQRLAAEFPNRKLGVEVVPAGEQAARLQVSLQAGFNDGRKDRENMAITRTAVDTVLEVAEGLEKQVDASVVVMDYTGSKKSNMLALV